MKTKDKTIFLAATFFATFWILNSSICGQTPTPMPSPASSTPTGNQVKGDAATSANAAVNEPAVSPALDFWHQETMTGDWGGARSRWKEQGVDLEFKLTQFVQGVASGGVRHNTVYNGNFESTWKFDLEKVAGWKFWSAEIKTEYRFGGPLLLGSGALNPVNTAATIPASSGSVVSITALNFTRLIPKDLKKGNYYEISFGRFNTVDMVDEQFFAGSGTEKFFNIAQIGPLNTVREVPLITNGATFAYVKGGEPFITFAVLDPNDHSLDPGIHNLFADGASFIPGINFSTKYWGKSGGHSLGGAVTTKAYSPFDAIREIILPGPSAKPIEPKRGSWSVSYIFRQYIVERGAKDGWGFFTQFAVSNKDTSPVTSFFDAGLGGNGLFKSRRRDEFGFAYAFTGLSRVLRDNIDLVTLGNRRPREVHQVEMFYNWHITPWLRLTSNLQVIRGVRRNVETAIIPGARLEMIF